MADVHSKSLILASTREEDIAFATVVAKVAGLKLEIAPKASDAVKILADGGSHVVFADGSNRQTYLEFESAVQNTLGLFSDRVNANQIHWLSSEDLQKATFLFESPIFGHYISRTFGNVEESGTRYGYVVKSTLREKAFGLEHLLPPDTKIQTIAFKNTKQKQEAVEAVKNFLLAGKFKSRMATVIANAVDELVMNAMFDAPVDEVGRQLYVSTPRDTEIKLEGRAEALLQVGYDKHYVAITAIDHFGSLDKNKLFSHISKRYIEEEYKVKTSIAGAGIGLATVFRSGGSFLFSSEKNHRTEVTVFFKRTDNFREFKDQFRFISTEFYF